jgi:capsular polysaccharide biosynthesis protein
VISKKGLIVIDSTMHPRQEFVAGQWQFLKSFEKTTNTCLIKRPTEKTRHLESAIFLIGRCDENWYHFIIDTVPRILFTNDIPSNVPLIIRADIPEHFKLVLSSLTERDIIEIELEENLEVQTLYVVPGRSSAFDSQPPKGRQFAEFSSSVLKKLQKLLVNTKFEPSQSQYPLMPNQKIALSRMSTTRNVQNWVSLVPLIKSFDFSIHDLNSNFFENQIETFHQTRVILAPGGAALANIVFMQEESYVVVLRSWRNRDVSLWKKLAEAMNVNCVEVVGIPTYFGPGKLRRRHSDFYVSPRKLRRVLTSVTASSTR